MAVGSVLAHARSGDAVWGSGVHEKTFAKVKCMGAVRARVHGVRGPYTSELLYNRTQVINNRIPDSILVMPEVRTGRTHVILHQYTGSNTTNCM